MIEFIKVEHDEETQFDDERSQEKPFVKYGNDSLEDEDDSLDMITEAAITKEKFILNLINSIRAMPVLWKFNSKGYRDPSAIQDAWNILSGQFAIPAEHLKEKWNSLQSQFRINWKKLRQMRESSDTKYYPTWYAFEAMRFLKESDDKVTEKVITHPLPKPVTIKRILTKPMHFSSMPKPYERDCERRYIGSTVTTPPKVVRITPHSSQSTYNPAALMGYTTSNKMDQCVRNTIRNLSKITDKIAETESSPYSGLLNHLTVVLSKKRANDFNEIEGVLLNCLNELNKFPNVTKDSIIEIPSTNDDYYYPKDEEREDSNDTNDM
ncbi:uncharacterized protein LOC128712695 [Anopheles marshallii]|uniref:uncharacterized protein LOC128712695 n=1 Tax=Anopheles marshallii TaxID=1521116 RepID=UPI00237BAC9B|nr:uncharacterized protein LOC128712695 [Anopheles marshallii]